MKYRYGYDKTGKMIRVAKIYSKHEHGIDVSLIDRATLHIVKTLCSRGYQTYIVGGAIRDILLGSLPKDFDIATNARPEEIKRVFRVARIVGKRFRIVIVPIGRGNFIEVSTFRSNTTKHNSMLFGTMDQDVNRRDFTCNALYYHPLKEELIDYVDAVLHIKKQKLVPIRTQFEEDPVRMLRAIKFSEKCKLQMPWYLLLEIRKKASLISEVSRSRMTEEVMKVLMSGCCKNVFSRIYKEKLLQHMLPTVFVWLKEKPQTSLRSSDKTKTSRLTLFLNALELNDTLSSEKRNRSTALMYFISAYVKELYNIQKNIRQRISANKIIDSVKQWMQPITPPNVEIQKAVFQIVFPNKVKNIPTSAKKPRQKKPTSLQPKKAKTNNKPKL